MNTRQRLSSIGGIALAIVASAAFIPSADAQTASGLTSAWGKTCKMRVVEQFDVPMSDALVNLGATEQQSIDEGNTSLSDIKKDGLSFNWEIRGKKINGYCNVNGKGKITEFKQAVN
jgi:hypothetical protein